MTRLVLVLLSLVSATALADSPLTSITFSTAYDDLPAVQAAKNGQKEKAFAFLCVQSNPNDQKLAVANALGGGSTVFVKLLEQLRPGDITPADQFVAGYLLAQDDYLELKAKGLQNLTAYQLLDKAAAALPNDFAVQFTRAIVRSQEHLQKNWCDVFKIPDAVLKAFPKEKRNLRPGAVESAMGYLNPYSEECAGSPAAKFKATAELNQHYSVSKLGKQLVSSTQGGIVVWQPESEKPVAVLPGFICNGITWHGAVWSGCETFLARWDGKAFKSYLKRTAKNSATYYHPMVGLDGALWVRLGKKLFAYDEKTDKFSPLTAPWGNVDPYDALVRSNGDVWFIDFLDKLVLNGRDIGKKSLEYPGSDPRRFREDARGTLWVEDFEQGLFRLDTSTNRFVREGGLENKGTGVAWDASRERLIMLHYTDGLVVKPNRGEPLKVDLRVQQNMRDLLLDENGDVWVGGWDGLVRLRPDGNTYGVQTFRVN